MTVATVAQDQETSCHLSLRHLAGAAASLAVVAARANATAANGAAVSAAQYAGRPAEAAHRARQAWADHRLRPPVWRSPRWRRAVMTLATCSPAAEWSGQAAPRSQATVVYRWSLTVRLLTTFLLL